MRDSQREKNSTRFSTRNTARDIRQTLIKRIHSDCNRSLEYFFFLDQKIENIIEKCDVGVLGGISHKTKNNETHVD